jgi:carboxymethylenebutenolidase
MSMGKWIDLTSADGQKVPAYVAQPDGAVRGAIVVLQEIFGVNSHIRSVADGYAQAGYLAVAPATFQRVQPGVDLAYTDADVQAGVALKAKAEALPAPGVLPDIQAAIDYAAAESGGGKVGIVGYCWGGLWAWRAAAQAHGLSAAVPYYGGGMTQPAEIARQPRVPVMAHLSDNDPSVPMDGVKALQAAHPQVQVLVYAAHHGFNCDQRASYHAAAAQQALQRTLAFLAQHVG